MSTTRRDRFRALRERLDATRPETAVEGGWVVEDPRFTMAERLWRDFELEPSRCVQLVGGVGSGKTTQLRMFARRVRQMAEGMPIIIDIDTQKMPLADSFEPGMLLGLAVHHLADFIGLPEVHKKAKELSHKLAELRPRKDDHEQRLFVIAGLSAQVFSAVGVPVILVLDGYDRLAIEHVDSMLRVDVQTFRKAKVGVLMAASLEQTATQLPAARDLFDVHIQPSVIPDGDGLIYLSQILLARDPSALISQQARDRLARASGGVLRDLIQLAHRATDVAYFHGADSVEAPHVEQATREFAQQQLFSVSDEELATLERVAQGQPFQLAGEKNTRLVTDRLVLDYGESRTTRRFALHPALRPLFETKAA